MTVPIDLRAEREGSVSFSFRAANAADAIVAVLPHLAR